MLINSIFISTALVFLSCQYLTFNLYIKLPVTPSAIIDTITILCDNFYSHLIFTISEKEMLEINNDLLILSSRQYGFCESTPTKIVHKQNNESACTNINPYWKPLRNGAEPINCKTTTLFLKVWVKMNSEFKS